MTYINFITGLIIAAVLSVPGAMQHEATQMGTETGSVELIVKKTYSNQYWVIGQLNNDYILTDQVPNLDECTFETALHPCEISTDLDFSSLMVPKDDIINNPEVQIESYRNSLN